MEKKMNHCFMGKWITSKEFCNLIPTDVFHRQLDHKEIMASGPVNSHILFRKTFRAHQSGSSYIYISADDYYKLYINGRFVCQGPAAGYPFHYYYNKVNISDYLEEGDNTIAVHTYYQGLINRVWVSGDDRHGLILDIEQDGENVLASDETFLYAYHSGFEEMGKCGYDTQFLERYVSGGLHEGFPMPGYDDSFWNYAKVRKYADYELYEQPTKMLVFEDIKPILFWDEDGVTADFGSTYAGYLCAEAIGIKGTNIEMLFGQELDEDGKVRWKLRANCDYREEWQLSGNSDILNQFDYKSFRYVRLNIPKECKVWNISMNVRHYPFQLQARPAVSEPELLKIWNLCVHTLKYGVQETIQDCMEREKGTYLGDGCYTALAYTILTGDVSVLKKLIDDSLRSSFVNPGLMTCASCSFMQEIAEYPLMMYYCLYSYYKLTGDKDYLARHYEQLKEILDYYRYSYAGEDGLLRNLDKWCVVEWPANYRDGYDVNLKEGQICHEAHNVINAHYIGAILHMNMIAEILGEEAYCDANSLVKTYEDAFCDKQRKLFKDSISSEHISVIANVFPLMYGLYSDKETENAIVSYVMEKGITSVMLFGAYAMLEGFRRIGRKDLVYQCMADEGAWRRMIREGATTTFEGWGKDTKWNTSLFHLTLSYGAIFLCDGENF